MTSALNLMTDHWWRNCGNEYESTDETRWELSAATVIMRVDQLFGLSLCVERTISITGFVDV